MGELRKDYILDRYVIIATERGKRPDEFRTEKKAEMGKACLFCPGSEKETPQEIYRYPENSEKWQFRVFPNKYPAVKPMGKADITTDNGFYTYSDSYGRHEVLVETPDHDKDLADLEENTIGKFFDLFRQRIAANLADPKVRYVSAFKNHGEKAGTSIQHTHCQLISMNHLPEMILRKEDAIKRFSSCPHCSVIQSERDSSRRCYENAYFIAFAPYASRFPFELIILPKRHVLSLGELGHEEISGLAAILKQILLKLKQLNADYNFYVQYGIKDMHLHIEVCPRMTTLAGFELSTGTIINIMTPEKAAEFYRG